MVIAEDGGAGIVSRNTSLGDTVCGLAAVCADATSLMGWNVGMAKAARESTESLNKAGYPGDDWSLSLRWSDEKSK